MYELNNYNNLSLVTDSSGNVIVRVNKKGKWEDAKYLMNKSRSSSYTYKYINIRDNNGVKHKLYIHKLIATNLISNPNNYTEVTFKDGDRLNCNINNLEWIDRKTMFDRSINKIVDEKIQEKSLKECAEDLFVLTGDLREDIGTPYFYSLMAIILSILGIIIFNVLS